eukprot:TRINITY_DN9346_c0_g1_i1.p1 TRINITY_DN9346_c0_g1~~TRINITY_DN9346_c0_g1_i1.p1  ORF type:complete len:298 (+),score=54.86 TRINITY_DN9346_c0_g1_i1:51-896(+)
MENYLLSIINSRTDKLCKRFMKTHKDVSIALYVRSYFGLNADEKVMEYYSAFYDECNGYLFLTEHFICFDSKLWGDMRTVFQIQHIIAVRKKPSNVLLLKVNDQSVVEYRFTVTKNLAKLISEILEILEKMSLDVEVDTPPDATISDNQPRGRRRARSQFAKNDASVLRFTRMFGLPENAKFVGKYECKIVNDGSYDQGILFVFKRYIGFLADGLSSFKMMEDYKDVTDLQKKKGSTPTATIVLSIKKRGEKKKKIKYSYTFTRFTNCNDTFQRIQELWKK